MSFVYANARDEENKRHYLVANTVEEILSYCWKADPRKDLEILGWPKNPPPFTVMHHYEWVGKGNRPAQLQESRPFNYANPNEKPVEKW